MNKHYEKRLQWWAEATPEEKADAILEWETDCRVPERHASKETDEEAREMREALEELKEGRPERLLRWEAELEEERELRHRQDAAEEGTVEELKERIAWGMRGLMKEMPEEYMDAAVGEMADALGRIEIAGYGDSFEIEGALRKLREQMPEDTVVRRTIDALIKESGGQPPEAEELRKEAED